MDIFADASAACAALAEREPTLRRALVPIGAPHIRRRAGGFEGLFRIIVEQQVSVPSAQAIWRRCQERFDVADAGAVLGAGPDDLRACGLSGPKTRYVLGLAEALATGALEFRALAHLTDEEASAQLQSIKGVGPWTAGIYLLFCEGRIDIWPPRDVALKGAYNAAKVRRPFLEQEALDARALRWAPYRGVAAHILWTYYAHINNRKPI
ncbi:MAG: DNA-3-methyladenine glycosylase 2 family protein [Pseudomonadota bacterium]